MSILLFGGCSSKTEKPAAVESTAVDNTPYHADNDIAMTLRSISDAIAVGEKLDSSEYNFRGILTDGTGRPLYTDIQGAPGEWEVRVIDGDKAMVSNLYLGDLLPEELQQYILSSLDIPDSLLVASSIKVTDSEGKMYLYDLGESELIFETKEAQTQNGKKGPLMNIALRRK